VACFLQIFWQEGVIMDIDLISTLGGLYVLTHDGRLGFYDEQRQFQIDAPLSDALHDYSTQLLSAYSSGEDCKHARIGVVYPAQKKHAWKTATCFFEDHAIRQLYPVGTASTPLTAFQKKNQHNSYFRGMEKLIGARTKDGGAMVFCPVLFDSGGCLAQYPQALSNERHDEAVAIPIVEILNLVAHVPIAQRNAPALAAIEEKVRTVLIERKRNHNGFTLLHDVRVEKAAAPASEQVWDDAAAREKKEVVLTAEDLDRLHISQRLEGVEQWLEIPNRPISTKDLCRFVHFRDLNNACLDVLAARSFVYTAPSGTALLEQGMMDNWNMYLLEGTLLLTTDDGKSVTVEGGSARADTPIAFLKPRKYKVITLTKVSFLWIHDALLQAIRDARGKASNLLPKVS
jgi:hypothetical protein